MVITFPTTATSCRDLDAEFRNGSQLTVPSSFRAQELGSTISRTRPPSVAAAGSRLPQLQQAWGQISQ